MATGDLHNAFMAQQGGHQINTKVNTAQTDAPKLNWLSRNLNNIGGGGGAAAGALAGAGAGAALGSVVPVLGTAVGGVGGGILGALLGGAGGGYAGEQAKQSAEGNYGTKFANDESKKQALIQGLLGAGGEGAGAVVGHLLPAASKTGGAITRGLEELSGKKVAQQVASNLPKDALQTGNDVARLTSNSELLSGLGLHSHAQRQTAGTIANDFLGSVKNQALEKSGSVPILDGLGQKIASAITDNGVAQADKNAITAAVKSAVSKAVGSEGAVGDMAASASKVFDIQKQLEKLGYQASRSGSAEKASAYRDLASHFADLIDSHAGTNAHIAAIEVPAEQLTLLTQRAIGALGKTRGTALADHLIEGVNQAGRGAGSGGGLADVRDLLASFVPGSKAATEATISGLQKAAPGVVESIPGAAVSPMGKLGAVRSVMGKLGGAESALAGKAAQITRPIGQLINKGVDATLGAAPAIPAAVKTLGDQSPAAASSELDQVMPNPVPQDAGSEGSGASVFSPSVLQAMALHDIQTTGGKNIDKISTLSKLFGADSPKKASGSVAASLADSKSAIRQLDQLEKTLASGAASTGPVTGRLRSLNPYDTGQQSLQSQLGTVAQIVAKGLEGGKLSDQDVKRYQRLLPNVTDTKAVALRKIAQVRSSLESRLQDYSDAVE